MLLDLIDSEYILCPLTLLILITDCIIMKHLCIPGATTPTCKLRKWLMRNYICSLPGLILLVMWYLSLSLCGGICHTYTGSGALCIDCWVLCTSFCRQLIPHDFKSRHYDERGREVVTKVTLKPLEQLPMTLITIISHIPALVFKIQMPIKGTTFCS